MPLYQKQCKGVVYVAIYVDDNLVIGSPKAIDEAVEQIEQNRLVLKALEIQRTVCQKIWFLKDEKKAWPGQPFQIERLEKNIGKQEVKA